jgi:CheY-like chemotaxis protein
MQDEQMYPNDETHRKHPPPQNAAGKPSRAPADAREALRLPLATILRLTEQLAGTPLSQAQQNTVEIIHASAARLLQMLDEFEFSGSVADRTAEPETGVALQPSVNKIASPRVNFIVLVIEDDQVNQRILQIMIQAMGFSVDTATDGLEGLLALEQRAYDIVILDMHMPKLNGLDTTIAIRRQFPVGRQPFIITLTADTQLQTREALQAAGSNAFLAKPFTRQSLADVVEQGIAYLTSTRGQGVEGLPSAGPQATGEPAVDERILEDLIQTLGTDPNEIAHFFTLYFETAAQLMEKVRAAAAAGDLTSLSGHLHALRGSSELFGATRLNRLCKETKGLLAAGMIDEIGAQIQEIRSEYDRVSAALRMKIQGQSWSALLYPENLG